MDAFENIAWNEIEDVKEYSTPKAGGYVMRIEMVENVTENQYLKLYLDFAEGEFKGSCREAEERLGANWVYQTYIRSYKPKARGYFKRFLQMLEAENRGFRIANFHNPADLEGLRLGVVLGAEERYNKKGELKEYLYVNDVVPIADIRNGNFKVPELKKLQANATVSSGVPFIGEDIPF